MLRLLLLLLLLLLTVAVVAVVVVVAVGVAIVGLTAAEHHLVIFGLLPSPTPALQVQQHTHFSFS